MPDLVKLGLLDEDEKKKKQEKALPPVVKPGQVNKSTSPDPAASSASPKKNADPVFLGYHAEYDAPRKVVHDLDGMNDRQAIGIAQRIVGDEARDDFLTTYRSQFTSKKSDNYRPNMPTLAQLRKTVDASVKGGVYSETRAAYEQQRIAQGQNIATLNSLGIIGFDGAPINWNTISFEDAIRTIRLTPDEKARKAALKGIKAMTEDGGRFAGHKAYDLTDSANKYIANSDFDLAAYEEFFEGGDYSKGVRGSFSASAGDSAENRALYESYLAEIEESDMSDYQKYWYKRGLDEVYKETTGVAYASRADASEAEIAPEAMPDGQNTNVPATIAEEATEGQKKAEKPGQHGNILNALGAILNAEKNPTGETEEVHDGPVEGEDYAVVGKYASATMSSGVVEAQPEETTGTVHLVGDPVRAAEYVLAGRGNELDEETRKYIDDITGSSTAAKAIFGGWHYDVQSLANQVLYSSGSEEAERYAQMFTSGQYQDNDISYVIGGRLGGYYNKTRNDSFPPELTSDVIGMILGVAMDAEDAYANNEFTYNRAEETLYDAYLRQNPQALANLDGAFRSIYEMQKEKREQDQLVADAAEATRQEQIASAQEAVRSGSYTQEQYALVLENAPVVTDLDLKLDDAFVDYNAEILAFVSEGYRDPDSWINQEMVSAGYSDLSTVAALDYRSVIEASIVDQMHNDLRVAKALGYNGLEDYYARQGGFSAERIADRAKISLQELDAQIDPEAIEYVSSFTGTDDTHWGGAMVAGAYVGIRESQADRLQAIWALDAGHREDRPYYEQQMRQAYGDKYGYSLSAYMYKQDMLAFAEAHPSAEMGQYIREYIESGADVFRLAIKPEMTWSLNKSAEIDRKAQAVQSWAESTYAPSMEGTFNISKAGGANFEMQSTAIVVGAITRSAEVGVAVGFGLPQITQETEAQLAEGKSMKYASTMGLVKGINTVLAESATSGALTKKALQIVGITPILETAGNAISNSRVVNAMYGMIKNASGQIWDEVVVDNIKDGTGWQVLGKMTEEMMSGSGIITSLLAGIQNIDVGETLGGIDMKDGIAVMLPNIFISGLGGAMEGWKATRKAAQKVAQTGSAEAAREFVEAFASDVVIPENRAELDEACEAMSTAVETVGRMMTDTEITPTVETSMAETEQADAHAQEAASSQARMDADMQVIIDVNDRIVAGDLDKSLPDLMGSAAADHNKAKQGLYEHTREEAQKRSDADRHMGEAYAAAKTKAGQAHEAEKAALAERMAREQRIAEIDARIGEYNRVFEENPEAEMTPEMEAAIDDLMSERMELENAAEADEAAQMASWREAEQMRYEAEQMEPVYKRLSSTPVYVDASQRANILAKTGLKSLGQVNVRYGLKLTSAQDADAISLDGSFFSELAEQAPGWIDAEASHPEDVLIDLMERKKVVRAKNRPSSLPAGIKAKLISPVNVSAQKTNADLTSAEKENYIRQRSDYVSNGAVIPAPAENGRAKYNPLQTFQRLAKDIHIGQIFGTSKMNGLEGRAAGYYDERSGYAAADVLHASNVSVVGHEIGHAVASRIGMTGTTAMVGNLPAAFTQNYDPADLPGEAFSEFFWRYMLNDDEARNFAGDSFVREFERRLRAEDMYDAVHTAKSELRRYFGMSAIEKSRAMVRDKSDMGGIDTIGERIAGKEREFIAKYVDSTRPAEDVNAAIRDITGGSVPENSNLRSSALMQKTAPRRAWSVLMNDLTNVNGTVVGESLKTRIEKSGMNGRDFDLLIDYMLAKHSIDRDKLSAPVFDRESITQAESKKIIADVESNHKAVVRAADAFQSFRHDFMVEYMVKPGYLKKEALAEFERRYPNYVPTYRVKSLGGNGIGGNTYTIRKATGSTEQIINPMDSFVDMVNTIVAMNLQNNVALTWDHVYNTYEGMGIFGRDVTEDMETTVMDMESVQERVREALGDADAEDDVIDRVLNIIGDRQIRRFGANEVNQPNVITVQMPDGSRRFYQIFDQQLYDMMAGTQDGGETAASLLGAITRGMSMLTTGSNPLFAITNALRDFQSSVNYGRWASNYATGAAKWLSAAWEVYRGESADFRQYQALGGGGWTRVNPNSKRGATEYRGEIFDGYNTSNAGRTAKWLGKKIWDSVTLARINEVVEQTSRFAEYKHGKHDLTTEQGRQEAYLAAQEVTTDFSRRGSSQIAADARKIIPFFNASLQGIYRTGRQLTEAERNDAGRRFIKTVINTGIVSAMASLWMLNTMDDEDKEEFFWLSDEMKAKHLYMPNFAPDVLGETPLIRIPLPQEPLSYAVHALVTNAVWSGEGEDWAIGLAAIADNMLNGLNPVSSTILDPIIALKTNKNWYGSNIVPRSMEGMYPTNQYSAETPDLFIEAARMMDSAGGPAVSPMQLQYLAEQYTGFVGQMVIPYISKNEFTGQMEGISAVIEKARNRLTSDPLKTNDVISCVYDSDEFLTSVTKAMKNDKPTDMLKPNLTEAEKTRAAEEAYAMTHKGGIVHTAKNKINAGYDEIDQIEGNAELTDEQKYELVSAVRREMCLIALDANEAVEAYREKYVTGESFTTRWLTRMMGGTDE